MISEVTNISINSVNENYSIVSEVTNNEIIKSQEVANIYMTGGDMLKSTYDTDYNGVVETCQYIDCGEFN